MARLRTTHAPLVYFIAFSDAENTRWIKIGCTGDLDNRIRGMRAHGDTHEMRDLVVLGVMPGGFGIETAVHRRFKALRVFGREWFRPAPSLLKFIIRRTVLPFELHARAA